MEETLPRRRQTEWVMELGLSCPPYHKKVSPSPPLPACSRFQLKLDTTAIRDDSRCKPFSRLDSLRTAALSHESDTRLGESYSFIYSFAIDTVPSDTRYKQRTCRRESRNWRHIFGLGKTRYLAWITASWHRIEIHLWLPFDHLYMDVATS